MCSRRYNHGTFALPKTYACIPIFSDVFKKVAGIVKARKTNIPGGLYL